MYGHIRGNMHSTATRQNGGHAQEARPLCPPPCTAHASAVRRAQRGPALPFLPLCIAWALHCSAAVARIAVPGLDSAISSAFPQPSYSRTSFYSTIRVRGPFAPSRRSVSHAVHYCEISRSHLMTKN
ncbi:hypothetical protein O988_08618 [Pseudogymnoascus sp. VKM F-3808]|nr:hypothetical protein O988_08618 [Pseudogymnoascus sp. VKM F-3808]